jgi:hypothetical protein
LVVGPLNFEALRILMFSFVNGIAIKYMVGALHFRILQNFKHTSSYNQRTPLYLKSRNPQRST